MLRSLTAAALGIGLLAAGGQAALAQNLIPCAEENGYCRVPYSTRVVYGVPGRSTAMNVRGPGIRCANDVFGDPAPGIAKRCAYVARRGSGGWEDPRHWGREGWGRDGWGGGPVRGRVAWRTCAPENGFCNFHGSKRVRYGAGWHFAEGVFRNGVRCNNAMFGDPAPGVPKVCQVLD